MDIPLEALTTFSYDGKVVVRGQEFVARSLVDAKVLTTIGKAKFAAHKPLTMEAARDKYFAAETTPEQPKRKYKRRDLTAESE